MIDTKDNDDDETFHTLLNLDRDPELQKAIANLVIAWSVAEYALQLLFFRILDDWKMGTAISLRVPTFEARVKLAIALCQHWKTNDFDVPQISKLIDKLSSNSRARNDWIHGRWVRGDGSKKPIAIFDYREPEGDRRLRPIKAADVNNHIQAVTSHAKKLHALLKAELRPE